MVFPGLLGSAEPRPLKTSSPNISPTTASSTTRVWPRPAAGTPAPPAHPRTRAAAAPPASEPPGYISDESHLPPLGPDPPDLRELNACLDALAAVFPDVQIEVFRDMFASFDGESRLALVADALLKNRVAWVKGRWRVAAPKEGPGSGSASRPAEAPPQAAAPGVPKKETFRSPEYKQAVRALAYHEFKGLPRSAINAVLAESNHSYLDARQTLVDLSSKSWRFALSSLLFRRKPPVSATEAEKHPLVVWRPAPAPAGPRAAPAVPALKSTGNAELDRELFAALIVPLRERARAERDAADRRLAEELNRAEAERAGLLLECACCFGDHPAEEFSSCTADGHTLCHRCVRRCLSEALFGQAWPRSVDRETGSLRCPAVVAAADADACAGRIPPDHLHRAVAGEKGGAEMLHQLEQRLADHSLAASGLPLVRCPFCAYAEVDDIYLPAGASDMRLHPEAVRAAVLLAAVLGCVPLLLVPLVLALALAAAAVLAFAIARARARAAGSGPAGRVAAEVRAAVARRRRRRRGLRFDCRAPGCGRSSCLSCGKAWADVHVCHESALVALRTQVEQAMSMAVKRVCPRCSTSFVKNSGCNKLTCPCGYKMCYVCRKDIGGSGDGPDVGYRHFCQHFRPHGDGRKCDQCNLCNLWETEDTDEVLRKAKEEAERKWREAEGRELSGSDVDASYLETGLPTRKTPAGVRALLDDALRRGRWPALAEVCDVVLDLVFV
ncbi:hypothetical protein VTJ83DRAFT_4178 [Remersonia thermophila]|uniref:RING-type domain-containing protein n=1 Tax=Remersonia thermophila TaxID=72144 RepID=A0ABR4DAQ2_9PEZI